MNTFRFSTLLTAALLISISAFSQSNSKPMKLQPQQAAPGFATTDVYGKPVSLSGLAGQKVLLSFERNAGCPICNLHVHQLLQQADALRAANTTVVLVYQSSARNMLDYLAQEKLPFVFIADPNNKLYNLYGIEQSGGKMMKGMFNGAMSKMKAGKKLFSKKIAMDGPSTTIAADFLIDPRGVLTAVHYGRYLGDQLSPEAVLKLVQ